MKAKLVLTGFLIGAAFLYQGCDYVPNVIQQVNTATQAPELVYRKVLVEDFTGHKCGNCPRAAETITHLEGIYGASVVPIAVHAGYYSVVNAQYPTDLRSQAGTDYDNMFSFPGYPIGLVNRKGYTTGNFGKLYGDWAGQVDSMYNQLADFKISISNTYNSSSNQVSTVVTTKAMNAKTGTFNLVVVLTEDSIIGEQLDYNEPAGPPNYQVIPNYTFNHVLRGAFNTSWGVPVISGSINKNDSVVKTYSNFQLAPTWRSKKCKVIAYVYDAVPGSATQYEVLQVETKDVE